MQSSKRQVSSSDCPASPYTTPSGLELQTYCGKIFPNNENADYFQANSTATSALDCFVQLARSRPPAYVAAFHADTQQCYFFEQGANTSDMVDEPQVDIAVVANKAQLAPLPTACPYAPNSVQQTPDGYEDFTILCDADFADFGDYCPYSLGPNNCPTHTDTMMECLDLCSHAHPLCKGISWNPDMQASFTNCYLKYNTSDSTAPDDGFITHSAFVTLPTNVTGGCPANSSVTASNGYTFDVSCREARSGSSNMTINHQTDLQSCLDACTSQSAQGCEAVVFDFTMENGYDNCYLLNETGTPTAANSLFAQLNMTSSPPQSPSNGHKSPKAWIAGPVIGGLAAIALLIGLWWWLRRRPQRKTANVSEQPAKGERYENDGKGRAAELEEQRRRHMLHANERSELRDPKSEALLQHELES